MLISIKAILKNKIQCIKFIFIISNIYKLYKFYTLFEILDYMREIE